MQEPLPEIYVGQWLARFDLDQVKVAEAAGIGKPYMSHLVSGKKNNPSAVVMLRISRALELTVNDLYEPPPPKEVMDAVLKAHPRRLAAVGSLVSHLRKNEGTRQ